MSLPSDVVDKLQQYVDEVFDKIKETAQSLVPTLPPKEQNKTAFIQTNTMYARCFLRSGLQTCGNAPLHHNMPQSCLFEYDLSVTKDNVRFTGLTNVGKINGTSWNNLSAAEVEYVENDLIVPWTIDEHFCCEIPHPGEIIATLTVGQVRWVNIHSHDDGDYAVYQSFHDTWGGDWQGSFLDIVFNTMTYTESGGYVTVTFSDGSNLGELYPNSSYIFAKKGYPFIANFKDQTFINNYITDNGAPNNYHTTYTTPTNKNIEIYYGDNYVIYNVEDDEPVSYDDIRNAFNIAINQINEDNDVDINVPVYPGSDDPEPVTDDDYIDMGLGVETDGMAMYNMAVLTRDDLIQLISDFETNADTGLSFLPHVLGLYKLGIESSQLLITKSEQIKLHKEPNGTSAFTSVDSYNIVKEQLQVIDCGSITVDREELLTNTYLDFSPYSTYEMFIPGCGWITLPDTVVGRTISVHIVFDLTTCSCKGVVRSEGELLGGSGSTLATVNGIIGSSVPLSINETGLQRGAIMSGAVQTVTALGTAGMGVGIGNPYMGMSGIAMAAGSLAETHIAGNATYTSTKGGATDYSVFGDGYKAVLKITRPKLEIPDNYGHTVGYVVNKYDTLGNYSGFTVCLNPHITGLTCTSDEKEEIARLLERGVILPAGE